MTYVISSACIDVKDAGCADCCPVDCIHDGDRMMYINPDECIDCGVCMSVCPVDAIHPEHEVPEHEARFTGINAQYFNPALKRAWAESNGGGGYSALTDHPVVSNWPKRQLEGGSQETLPIENEEESK